MYADRGAGASVLRRSAGPSRPAPPPPAWPPEGPVRPRTAAGVGCQNWWTDARSQVERSVFMDDYVFSVSRTLIKVNSVKDLTQDLASISLAD